MPVYTVHEPPLSKGETEGDPIRIAFVRDGFSFWAFLLGPLWMLWHRLWLAFIGYIVVAAALHISLFAMGVTGGTRFAASLLLAILVGLEANSLRRWTLSRRRWRNVGVVVADDPELAERRFFDAWTGRISAGQIPATQHPAGASAPPPVPAPPPSRPGARDVIGLFPKPGTWR
jgi:hypothetical protein